VRVAYAGEPGAFGELAARAVGVEAEPWPLPSFEAVARAVAHGEVEAGVIPVANSIAGEVEEGVAAILLARPWISGEVRVRVRQLLLAPPGVRLEDVGEVHSHPQALAQCRAFLAARGLRPVAEANTATAARLVSEGAWPGAAAIAGRAAAERFGLSVIAEGIADAEVSETRFYVLGQVSGGAERTVMVVEATQASQSRSEDRSHRSSDTASAEQSRSEDRSHGSSDHRAGGHSSVRATQVSPLLELDGDDLPEGAVLLGRIARAEAPTQTEATASTSS
jgi:prephenate dehydratase